MAGKLDYATPLPRQERERAWPWAVAAGVGLALYLLRTWADGGRGGVGLFFWRLGQDVRGHWEYAVALVLAGLALIPGGAGALSRGVDRLRRPSAKVKALVAAIVFIGVARYLILNSVTSERELFPSIHDEFIHQVQAQMLARGRLWMPEHRLADFFDSYFMFVRPVYAASPFPGASLLYVPGVWLGVAPWVTAVLIAGAVAALLYLVVTELIDGVAGLLAVPLLLSVQMYRLLGTLTMSYVPMAGIVLGVVWCYVKWRRAVAGEASGRAGVGLAAAVGALAGWGAITRPLDAVCLILPVAGAMAWQARRLTWRRAGVMAAAAVTAAMPFIALQLVFDKGVTGHWSRPPIGEYGRANFPGHEMGYRSHPDAEAPPEARAQVRDFYDVFIRDTLRFYGRASFASAYVNERLLPTADVALPARLLYVLLPLGLLAMRRWPGVGVMVLGGVLLMPLAQTFWPPWVRFYGVASAGGFIVLALLGAEAVRRRWPGAGAALAIGVLTVAVGSLPEVRGEKEVLIRVPVLRDINQNIAAIPNRPAVVLFHYEPAWADEDGKARLATDVFQEPVYNVDAAWPDDAEVVRANDLGPARNREIYDYYPNRYFYRYDRTRIGSFEPMGWGRDLVGKR